ncbi:hypothetical protein O181_077108 [Austropuccinia psidii MF-1]|uniref:Reverse transcriptase Ty1/copia-type domain-containing protein n=1 Tax=Austropuccinia psidii MF-1 TaxID=1389203 RepID=A0A9Q3FC52_9BASI|nr:hypothetical protein [Austropuccinia psidii MF-1]
MHVDDGVIFSNNQNAVDDLKKNLMNHLQVKWEDTVTIIVGINLDCTENALILSQIDFAKQIIQHFEQKNKSSIIQMLSVLPEKKLTTSNDKPLEQKWYQSIIGSLNYLALGTRPDLNFAVGYLARYSVSPQQEHWDALIHLLGYLKHTVDRKLVFDSSKIDESLDLWSDADWGGEFQRSTSGVDGTGNGSRYVSFCHSNSPEMYEEYKNKHTLQQ